MKKTIFKFTLRIADHQTIVLPASFKFLTAQFQGNPNDHGTAPALQLWALVDTTQPLMRREIGVYGTGNPLPVYPGEYIATAQQHGGLFVWHVFDLGPAEVQS